MNYICPDCRKEHPTFESAGECCKADFVECPLSELPVDAEFGGGIGKYGYGTVFTGRWEIFLNGTPANQSVRVYALPPFASKMVMTLTDERYKQGIHDAKAEIRRALEI